MRELGYIVSKDDGGARTSAYGVLELARTSAYGVED